ncbi:hypothetical protein HMPREF9088_1951 [Enterococcus italicus DSM 15952]|uniref:Uncharacterized protein n=1 Tax=Enterococcus italicus (strain DSM 15952 / CCUG 50447 / LMG 22039 / TP 1.5) TaxID=888064 RepID=E6LHW1_ENTI1|nr:hypothetical protein HMPREF9088_1951 [Enterococcus italicus DSM 15952]
MFDMRKNRNPPRIRGDENEALKTLKEIDKENRNPPRIRGDENF